jgi:hypothetical protein
MHVEARNVSTSPVRLNYDDIRLNFSGESLRPISVEAAIDEVAKLKRIPGVLRFLGRQSTAFQPKALERMLNARSLDDGDILPNDTRTGLVFFMRPESATPESFNGVLWVESNDRLPQLLQTKGVDVYTRPGPPGLAARIQDTLKRIKDSALSPRSFNKSYALLVGIEKYRHLEPLSWSVADTQKMRDFLVKQGFDEVVTVTEQSVAMDGLKNPQRYFSQKVQANDRFLFYFSGHGQTALVGGHRKGFLPLFDEVPGGTSRSIPMRSLVDWMRGLKTQHLLVILDSCFSGLATGDIELKADDRPSNPKVDLEEFHRLSRGPAQYLLMAGTADQKSLASSRWNGSLFTEMVIRGLRKEADLFNNRLITTRALYVWLKPKVVSAALDVERELTPLLLDLGPNGVSRGEFVFTQ